MAIDLSHRISRKKFSKNSTIKTIL